MVSSLSLDIDYLFLVESGDLLLIVVQELLGNFGALVGGDECMSFYSTILNRKAL